ncbi:MAG: response regulator, partial [Acaryochloris sp. SU_5_25]|nr:response regulator [Acaryochloris sp. SU_5_25]
DRFEVYEAENGSAGLAKAAETNPDLILLDYVMPGMDGYEVYQSLRAQEQFRNTPIIVMSGRHDEVVEKFGPLFDNYNFWLKQASQDQLRDRINAVLPMTVSGSETENTQTSVNVEVQDIAAFMSHLGQLENQLTEKNGQRHTLSNPEISPRRRRWIPILLIAAGVSAIATLGFYSFTLLRSASQKSSPQIASGPPTTLPLKNIAALGRLEPQGEITRLSAPNSLEGSRIDQLLIKEGDLVKAGQVVAILDSQTSRLRAWRQAQSNIVTAQARLAKVKAGAKSGEINAQKANILRLTADLNGGVATQEAEIARIEAELGNAQVDYERYRQLYSEGAVSKAEFDNRQLKLETVQNQLSAAQATLKRLITTVQAQKKEAQATLGSIEEVRPVDVEVAQAEVTSAIVAAEKAKADLDLTYICAPINGNVLEVNTRPGEVISNEGIANIGRTDRMYVVAEIYETDIKNIRAGQNVTVTSDAFADKLSGKVDRVGLQVKRQGVFDVNPLAKTDYKVVEVKVRLDAPSSQKVAGLSNLQVQVVIQTDPS